MYKNKIICSFHAKICNKFWTMVDDLRVLRWKALNFFSNIEILAAVFFLFVFQVQNSIIWQFFGSNVLSTEWFTAEYILLSFFLSLTLFLISFYFFYFATPSFKCSWQNPLSIQSGTSTDCDFTKLCNKFRII